jgi:hypothetical protein
MIRLTVYYHGINSMEIKIANFLQNVNCPISIEHFIFTYIFRIQLYNIAMFRDEYSLTIIFFFMSVSNIVGELFLSYTTLIFGSVSIYSEKICQLIVLHDI